jgi:hypothetical protein
MAQTVWRRGFVVSCIFLFAANTSGQQLPAIATSDDIAAIARIELKQIALPATKKAAAEAFGQPELSLAPILVKLELRRLTLLRLGCDTVLITIPNPAPDVRRPIVVAPGDAPDTSGEHRQPDRGLMLCHVPGDHTDQQATSIALMVTQDFVSHRKWFWQDDWLIIHDTLQLPKHASAPGTNAKQFEAALEYLGHRPGIAMVRSPTFWIFVTDERKKAGEDAQREIWESFLATLERYQSAQWAVLAAELGDKPTLKIEIKLPDAVQATRAATALKTLQPQIKTWAAAKSTKKPGDFGPPGDQCRKLLGSCPIDQTSSRIQVTLNAQRFGQFIDIFYIQKLYRGLDIAVGEDHPWRSLLPLSVWIENYSILYLKLPNSLYDLKPLLGVPKAEQEAHFRRLLTNTTTGEFPSVAYTKLPLAEPGD